MKTLEVSDSTFKKLETLRRTKRSTRNEALTQAIDEALGTAKLLAKWESRKPTPAAAKLSEQEIERLAVEGVRESRRQHRQR